MKIIISRKGFDSGYGGVPSPIFPDGRMVSLPILSPAGLVASMGRDTLIHIDPDLDKALGIRPMRYIGTMCMLKIASYIKNIIIIMPKLLLTTRSKLL